MKITRPFLAAAACCACLDEAGASEILLKAQDILVRDPYIYADVKSATYFMYAQSGHRPSSGFTGVEVYRSKDLINWEQPRRVLTLPDDAGIQMVWAPEMHVYNGKYYLFATLTCNGLLTETRPVANSNEPALDATEPHVYTKRWARHDVQVARWPIIDGAPPAKQRRQCAVASLRSYGRWASIDNQ